MRDRPVMVAPMMIDLKGLVVPPPTPFNDKNEIDVPAFIAHLEFLAGHGVTRILVNGTTAEFFSLLPEERRQLLRVARSHFQGVLLFNTASDSLLQAREAAHWAEESGADAIVAMPPYYYANAPLEGLIEFFNELADSVDLPMVLYNFAEHTNNPITPAILRKVKHAAIKDSSGDHSLIAETPCYLAGTSRGIVEAHRKGAAGFVSSLANCLPGLYVRLEAVLKEGRLESAEELQREIKETCREMPVSGEIAGIKSKLAELIPSYPGNVRLPLI